MPYRPCCRLYSTPQFLTCSFRAPRHHDIADDFRGLCRPGAALLQEPAVNRTPLPGDEGLLVAAADVPLDRGPGRGHVALCVLAATIEAVMAQDLVKREADRSQPGLPVDDATAGPLGVERGPVTAHLRRRLPDQAREPAQRPLGQGAPGPLRRHLDLVQGRNRLTRGVQLTRRGTRLVRGHEKVPACGQDEVPTRGHVEVPTPH